MLGDEIISRKNNSYAMCLTNSSHVEIIDSTKEFSRDNVEKNNGFQTNLDNAKQYNWSVE